MIRVIADTNIWMKTKVFKSVFGVNLIYYLRSQENRLILPEIIGMELIPRIRDEGEGIIKKLESTLSNLQTHIGQKPNIEIPEIQSFEKSAVARINELDAIVEKIDFDLDICKKAINRAINRIPPCHNREEIRDAILWEMAIEHSIENDNDQVIFITEDKDFKLNNDFHPVIREEANRYNIILANEISEIIQSLRTTEPPELDRMQNIIEDNLPNYQKIIGEKYGFKIFGQEFEELNYYATEKLHVLIFDFLIKLDFINEYTKDMLNEIESGIIIVKGEGETNLKNGDTIIKIDSEEIFDEKDLSKSKSANIYLRMIRDQKYLPYTVKVKIQ